MFHTGLNQFIDKLFSGIGFRSLVMMSGKVMSHDIIHECVLLVWYVGLMHMAMYVYNGLYMEM